MARLSSVILTSALAMAPVAAVAQTVTTGSGQQVPLNVAAAAADSAMSHIRTQSVGSGYTVDSIRQGILNQNRAFGASTGFYPVSTVNSSLTGAPGLPQMSGGKPFAGMQQSSTISPYLNLFNQGPTGRQQTLDNYNLLVRPMLDQQRMNSQMQRQQMQMNMQVQAIAAKPDFEFAGSEKILPTGHQTGYGYYSHFYPRMQQIRRQK